jgi:hypothetical protein
MDTNSLIITLEQLKKDRTEQMDLLSALDKTIALYEMRIGSNHNTKRELTPLNDTPSNIPKKNLIKSNPDILPVEANPKEKLYLILRDHIKSAIKFVALQDQFEKLTGISRNIRVDAYELRREGKIISIMYNGYNNNVFWGLPEWTVQTDIGLIFGESYGPDASYFPKGIWKGEEFGKSNSNAAKY